MIQEAIQNFYIQFQYNPIIENGDTLGNFSKYILVGMGGSHLAGDLLKIWKPDLDIIIHSDYGLPELSDDDLHQRLIILNSYSGNTEEVLHAFQTAFQKKLPMLCISIGGKLLELAKNSSIPYIQIPNTNIQPRMAVGFSMKALIKIIGSEQGLRELTDVSQLLKSVEFESATKNFAEGIQNRIPLIYASRRNAPLAEYWKIALNEGAKIPAFWNVFPELNHNEIAGFDTKSKTDDLLKNFLVIILRDLNDDPKILKRMEIFQMILARRHIPVEVIDLKNELQFYKIFYSVLFVSSVAYFLAENYGVDPDSVPIIEEFKELIQ